ncbi:hypothetical protein OWR29_01645 [Actinoplanes sp. Pm04-4]|uniref:Uncharacterized protein n=1 Tax=Paractinoplanes pyxinae TaxID=2997416 RepID=A0ABT4AR17_9ACTN|nr:hypothetical protein [Actinoplanes pyxinae]MCY1136685.1 hypothetical protein [Actinoplanes pyxinae]
MVEDAADTIDFSVEDPERPFEPWLAGYVARMAEPDALAPAGPLGAECSTAADDLVRELEAVNSEDRWRRFTRKLALRVLDAYWHDDEGEIWTEDDPDRPFARWLADRLDDGAIVVPQGSIGAQCRDAAYDLVTRLRENAGPDSRTEFVRILAGLLYRSYIDDYWVEVTPPYR